MHTTTTLTPAHTQPVQPMAAPLLVPSVDAARMLAIGHSTFWREVKKGTLPAPVKIAGATRWRVADLQLAVSDAVAGAVAAASAASRSTTA